MNNQQLKVENCMDTTEETYDLLEELLTMETDLNLESNVSENYEVELIKFLTEVDHPDLFETGKQTYIDKDIPHRDNNITATLFATEENNENSNKLLNIKKTMFNVDDMYEDSPLESSQQSNNGIGDKFLENTTPWPLNNTQSSGYSMDLSQNLECCTMDDILISSIIESECEFDNYEILKNLNSNEKVIKKDVMIGGDIDGICANTTAHLSWDFLSQLNNSSQLFMTDSNRIKSEIDENNLNNNSCTAIEQIREFLSLPSPSSSVTPPSTLNSQEQLQFTNFNYQNINPSEEICKVDSCSSTEILSTSNEVESLNTSANDTVIVVSQDDSNHTINSNCNHTCSPETSCTINAQKRGRGRPKKDHATKPDDSELANMSPEEQKRAIQRYKNNEASRISRQKRRDIQRSEEQQLDNMIKKNEALKKKLTIASWKSSELQKIFLERLPNKN